MRIDPATLDPTSKLAARIAAALVRDARTAAPGGRLAERVSAGAIEKWTDEEALQRAVVAMIAAEARPGVLAFHVPNGGRRGKAEAGRLKAMGTLAGVPDLVLLIDGRAHGLELKTSRGRPSASQKALAERWRRAGGEYEIARTVAEARAAIARWGGLVDGATGHEP